MHEFALARSMLRIVLEAAEAHQALRVRTVHCRIGAMRQVVPSVLQTAFEACSTETIAVGADLMIEVDPVTVSCQGCGAVRDLDAITYHCPICDSTMVKVENGTAMEITSITVDQEDEDGHSDPAERAGA